MNSQWFSAEEIKKGLHLKLLNYLFEYNALSEEHYFDIHISNDGYAITIEWEVSLTNFKEENGHFVYLKEGQAIATEVIFPDNHIEYVFSEDEEKMRLNEWLEENPGWVKTSYGTWTNEIENEKFRKEIDKMEKRIKD